jgi:hypothetical protein
LDTYCVPDRVIFSDGGWPRPWCYSILWLWLWKPIRVTIYEGVVLCESQLPRRELVHRSSTVVVNHALFAPPGVGRWTLELVGEQDECAHVVFPLPNGMRQVRRALESGGFEVQESRSRWIPRGPGREWIWPLWLRPSR